MSFETIRRNQLEYLRATGLPAAHGFSTRYGGVSAGPLSSLNLGFGRGDDPDNVRENWRRFGEAVGFATADLVLTHQVHGDVVRVAAGVDRGQGFAYQPAPDCDALVSNVPGIALAVFTADCTPVLLCDTENGAVAAVHAGWRGTALGIVKKAVETMQSAFGSDPGHIRAAIGPCIDRCCFETRSDVPEAMRAALGPGAEQAIDDGGDGTFHVDLTDLNLLWLRRAGVKDIETCPFCTACAPERFWSHRRVGTERGSLAAVIVCPEGRG